MPTKKLIVVHDPKTDQLTVQHHANDDIVATQPVPYVDPLDLRERAQLRWYLEEYLSFPVGAEEEKARDLERRLPEWGTRLFAPLFGQGAPGRDLYVAARNAGLDHYGFEMRYASGRIRNVPWELLHDSDDGFFLAHQFAAFSRRHASKKTTVYDPRPAGDELRLLVVTARPYGLDHDVPYRTVTRPIMTILDQPALRDRIHVEMLRPPTFHAFQNALQRKRDDGSPFFDVVHFDGHGGFGLPEADASESGPPEPLRVLDLFKGPAGMLVFESDTGTEDRIEVAKLQQVVGEHRVPLIVLNACRSGMEALEDPGLAALVETLAQSPKAKELALEAAGAQGNGQEDGDGAIDVRALLAGQGDQLHSVAGTLLEGGAEAVVSMGYIVRAKAAAIFMGGFYGKLLEGGSAAEAVSAGRVSLMTDAARPTQFGPVDLQDWMIPVYSERFDVRLFTPRAQGADVGDKLEQLRHRTAVAEARRAAEAPLPARPRFGFVGRDKELLTIERTLLDPHLAGAALIGLGGNGKTTLAVGAARWLVATNAPQVRGGVFFHAFLDRDAQDQPVHPNLDRLARGIGQALFAEDEFLTMNESEQRAVVAEYLRTEPCLLVLDNAETVTGLGEQSPLLSQTEQAELATFLRDVCMPNGSSRVLLTSRREEAWLGLNLAPLAIGGLDREAAEELAQQVLRTTLDAAALDAKRLDGTWANGYRELLRTLGGHPMALQIMLPHLAQRSPQDLLDDFGQGKERLDGQLPGANDRERTLRGSLGFSVSTLSQSTRDLLPFLAFFREWVDPDHLAHASKGDAVPERLQNVDDEAWMEALIELQATGLVTRLSAHPRSPFALHALLPWYLATDLDAAADGDALEGTFRTFAATFAAALFQSFKQDSGAQAAMFQFQRNVPTLRHALDLARRRGEIGQVGLLFQCLHELMTHSGHAHQAQALLDSLLADSQPRDAMDLDSDEGALWLNLQERHASMLIDRNQLQAAEDVYEELTRVLGDSDPRAAAIYHQRGIVAHLRRNFDAAERWCRKGLEILLRTGKESEAATSYHQLGMVAQERRDFDAAEKSYKKSLEIKLRIGHEDGAATTYHQLGIVAEERRDFDAAEKSHKKSLEIKLRIGNESGAASSYHQLGMVAQERRDFDAAERWYKKSLEIELRIGNEAGTASSYHQLGIVAEMRRDFDAAKRWYKKSLEIELRIGNEGGAAISYHQLGRVAQERRDLDAAQSWYRKGLEIKLRIGNQHGAALTLAQMGILALLQERGAAGAEHLIKALRLFQTTNDSHGLMQCVHNLRIGLRKGLVDRPLIEQLWQKHFDAPIPDDIADVLFAEGDDDAPTLPTMPPEMRAQLKSLLDGGLSMEQVIHVLEQGTGSTLPPEMVAWLTQELEGGDDTDDEAEPPMISA